MNPATPSPLRRRLSRYGWKLLGISAIAVFFMVRSITAPSVAAIEPPAFSVLVQTYQAQPVNRELRLQGQLEAYRTVDLRAETDGQVTALAVPEGARVHQGQALLLIAEDDRKARLAEATAQVERFRSDLKAEQRLQRQGLQARQRVAEVAAALASAEAALAATQLDIERTRIKAPFDGVVNRHQMEVGDLVERGNPVLTLVDDNRLKVTAQIPQQSLPWVKMGLPVRVTTLNGDTQRATISFVSIQAQAGTRSFRVEADLANTGGNWRPGLSATLTLELENLDGHFLSPATLTLDEQSRIGVKTVDPQGVVAFYPVEVLRAESDGVWVSGLPASARVILQGQGFVQAGEQVKTRAIASSEGAAG